MFLGILKKHPDSFSISTLIMNKYKNISSQLPKWLGYIAHVSENVINQNLCTIKFPSVRNTRQKIGDATSRIRTLERNETLWRIHSEV